MSLWFAHHDEIVDRRRIRHVRFSSFCVLVRLCFYLSALCGGVNWRILALSKCSNEPSAAFMPWPYAGQFFVPRILEPSYGVAFVCKPPAKRLDDAGFTDKPCCHSECEISSFTFRTRLRSKGRVSVIVLPTGWLSLKSPMDPEVLVWHVAYEILDDLVHAGRIEHWIAAGEIL